MFNAVIPELAGVLTVRICTQKWPSCLWWITPALFGTVLFKIWGSRPINGSPQPFPAFHLFRLLEKSPGFITAKLYPLGSPSSFPHFEVDDRTLIRNSLGREGNRPDWLTSPRFCLVTLAAFCVYRGPIHDQLHMCEIGFFTLVFGRRLGVLLVRE